MLYNDKAAFYGHHYHYEAKEAYEHDYVLMADEQLYMLFAIVLT